MIGLGLCPKDTFVVVAHVSNTLSHSAFANYANTFSSVPSDPDGCGIGWCGCWPWYIDSKALSSSPLSHPLDCLPMTIAYYGLLVDFAVYPWICYFSSEVMWIGWLLVYRTLPLYLLALLVRFCQ